MAKKRWYKVTVSTPRYAWVKAADEEEAIELAQEQDSWTDPFDYGSEDYKAEIDYSKG